MGEGGSEEKAIRNQKPVESWEGAWVISTFLASQRPWDLPTRRPQRLVLPVTLFSGFLESFVHWQEQKAKAYKVILW